MGTPPRSARPLLPYAVLMVVGATACDDSAEPDGAAFTRQDSAGVVIVTTEGSAARRMLGWTIDAQPDLQIGQVDGPEEYLFDRIDGITGRADGAIIVVDRSEQVRYFDARGEFLHSIGRDGSGPGEFRSVILVSSAPSDSLLLYDPRLGRFTLIDRFGAHLTTIDTRSVGTPLARAGNSGLMEIRSIWIMGVPGPHARTRTYALLDLTNGDTTTLGVFRGDQVFVTRDLGELPSELRIPFTTAASAAAANAEIYINDGLHPEIRVYNANGNVRGFARLREPVDRVTNDEYAAFVATHARQVASAPEYAPLLARVYHAMPVPDTAPAFDAILVASDGWLWARTYDPDADAAPLWMLFDTARVARGTIESPAGLEIDFITPDFVLG